jgi:N-acetyl-anhydromuramyl-L-alanine amidase AmpD
LRGKTPRNPNGELYTSRALEDIKYLTVHHTAASYNNTPEEIAQYHIDHENFPGIGYTFVIRQAGDTYQTQDLHAKSYHVASRNTECLGICLVGDFTQHHPTEKQIQATKALIIYLHSIIPKAQVTGHRFIALPEYPTACPGDMLAPKLQELFG